MSQPTSINECFGTKKPCTEICLNETCCNYGYLNMTSKETNTAVSWKTLGLSEMTRLCDIPSIYKDYNPKDKISIKATYCIDRVVFHKVSNPIMTRFQCNEILLHLSYEKKTFKTLF